MKKSNENSNSKASFGKKTRGNTPGIISVLKEKQLLEAQNKLFKLLSDQGQIQMIASTVYAKLSPDAPIQMMSNYAQLQKSLPKEYFNRHLEANAKDVAQCLELIKTLS